MKVTLFTGNQERHNYFINLLSDTATELNVIQENRTLFPGVVSGGYPQSDLMRDYFLKVSTAQKKIFCTDCIASKKKNINLLSMAYGDLDKCSTDFLSDFLESDLYIVFGSSYVKNELAAFLVKHKTLNIHMGVSPYYRGTDCNFWALYDNNPHLVGATVHYLSKGIDAGPILYHALTEVKQDPFLYTMSAVKAAFHSIVGKINNKSIFNISAEVQKKSKLIRYSKKKEFTDKILSEFLLKKIDLNSKSFDAKLYKDPYFLKKL